MISRCSQTDHPELAEGRGLACHPELAEGEGWLAIRSSPKASEGWRKRLGVEPSLPLNEAATGFEDREGHRAPFASMES